MSRFSVRTRHIRNCSGRRQRLTGTRPYRGERRNLDPGRCRVPFRQRARPPVGEADEPICCRGPTALTSSDDSRLPMGIDRTGRSVPGIRCRTRRGSCPARRGLLSGGGLRAALYRSPSVLSWLASGRRLSTQRPYARTRTAAPIIIFRRARGYLVTHILPGQEHFSIQGCRPGTAPRHGEMPGELGRTLTSLIFTRFCCTAAFKQHC